MLHVAAVEEGELGAHGMTVEPHRGGDEPAPARSPVAALHAHPLEALENHDDPFAGHAEGDHQLLLPVHLAGAELLVVQGAAKGPGVHLGLHAVHPQARERDVLQPSDGDLALGHGTKVIRPRALPSVQGSALSMPSG